MKDTHPLMSEQRAAEYLDVAPRTLRKWRTDGDGPAFVRISARCIRYRMQDLDFWLSAKTCGSTSEYMGK
jgi:hypothetical protein